MPTRRTTGALDCKINIVTASLDGRDNTIKITANRTSNLSRAVAGLLSSGTCHDLSDGKPVADAGVFAAVLMIIHGRPTGDTVLELLLIGGLGVGFYVLSLKLNPYVRCSRCKNSPKRKAWAFSYAHHTCPKCQGTGQQLRFGRRLLFGPPLTPGDR